MIVNENLRKNAIFNKLTEEEAAALLKQYNFKVVTFEKETIIAHEDDKCNSIGLIISGKLEVSRLYSCGKEIVISTLSSGDVFGEAIVFSTMKKYPATLKAVEKCELLFITKDELMNLFSANGRILEGFLEVLSTKVLMMNKRIKNISFKSLRHKVVNYILENRNLNDNKVFLSESKEKLAAVLGIPRPSLSRELMALRDMGYIDFDRKMITIIDEEALEEEMFN